MILKCAGFILAYKNAEFIPRAAASIAKQTMPIDGIILGAGGTSNATLLECAICEVDGTREFFSTTGTCPDGKNGSDWDYSGSLLAPDRHSDHAPWVIFKSPILVKCTTLDRMASGIKGIIDFAWIDVQGAEAMVLRGGQSTITRLRWWYCECHSYPNYKNQATLNEILSLLPGFELFSKHGQENFLFYNTSLEPSK